MLTKVQLRTRVQGFLDAGSTSRWDFTANGEVDVTLGRVQDREWRRILNAAPYYNVNRKSIPIYSDGTSKWVDLNDGGGDSQIYPYRIIALSLNNIVYEEVRPEMYLLPNLTGTPQPTYIWYLEGNSTIRMFPNQNSTQPLLLYNYIPERQERLSGETTPINFLDGYEDVLVYEACSRLLLKGGEETDTSRWHGLQAEELRQDMLQDVMRRSTKPVQMRYADDRTDWAG